MKSPISSFVKKSNFQTDFWNNFNDYEWTYIQILKKHTLWFSNQGQWGNKFGITTLKYIYFLILYKSKG